MINFPKIEFHPSNLKITKTKLQELFWVGLAGTLSFLVFDMLGIKQKLIDFFMRFEILNSLFSIVYVKVFFIVGFIFLLKDLFIIKIKNGGRDLF